MVPPLRVQNLPVGIHAGRLVGTTVQGRTDVSPDGPSRVVSYTRSGADRPVLSLLVDVRAREPLPGSPLTVKAVDARGVTLGTATLSERLLRPGQSGRWTTSQGPVCVTLSRLTPVRADTVERGAPPIRGYRVTLLVETPDPATTCQ